MKKAFVLASIVACFTPRAWADEVVLKNGDKITGKVVVLVKGKLALETPYAGVIQVNWADVTSIKTEGNVKVKTATGDLMEGTLSPGAQGLLKVAAAGIAEPVVIELGKVTYLNEPPVEWHGGIDLAYRATDGNTHTQTFFATADGTRESDLDKFSLRVISAYSKTSGVMTARNTYGLGKYDYKFTPDLYGYVSGEFISDTFKDIDLRSIFSVGAGCIVAKEKAFDLWGEAGIAYINNNFKITPDEGHLGARVMVHGRVAVPWVGVDLIDDLTYYPNFKHATRWQLHNEAAVATSVGKGWTLKAGVITDYDHAPPLAGVEKQDDVYYIGLGYHF
jgi:putative salt-induced outer membrane protein YdiY